MRICFKCFASLLRITSIVSTIVTRRDQDDALCPDWTCPDNNNNNDNDNDDDDDDNDDRPLFYISALLPNVSVRDRGSIFSTRTVAPAIDLAIRKVHGKTWALPFRLCALHADSRCDIARGVNEAFRFFMCRRVDVFFGPCCDYAAAPVGRQVAFWNLPMVTPGAMSAGFRGGKTGAFRLMTRIGANFYSLSAFVYHILMAFQWRRVKILYQSNGQDAIMEKMCHLVVDSVVLLFRDERMSTFTVPHAEFVERASQYKKFLTDEVGRQHAILLLCADPDAVRDLMLRAYDLNFGNGEYVFLNIDIFGSNATLERPWFRSNDTAERNEKARKMHESLMTLTLRKPNSEKYRKFSEEVKKKALESYGDSVYGDDEANSFVGAFHDAVILYALALNETLAEGKDPRNGTEITKRMWNRTFEGIAGTVTIDEVGDRNADYSLLDMNPETGLFQAVAHYYGDRKLYEEIPGRNIHWAGGRDSPPPDYPECGFDGLGCPKNEPFPDYAVVTTIMGSLLILVSLAACLVYRHYKLEAELAEVNWRVRWDDIMFGAQEKRKLDRNGSHLSLPKRGSVQSLMSTDTIACQLSNLGAKQVFTKTGSYKGTLLAIKKITGQIAVNKPLLMQLKKLRDLQNDHIVRIIGLCIDVPNQCMLTEYCPKGSLQDVLENEQIKLDGMFKFSLIQDIVRGMAYIHNSEIRSHGNLKSSNCVVDSRFVLKLTDFGLQQLRQREGTDRSNEVYLNYRAKLWTAPELLRVPSPPPEGTQKADVYSFAIICQEVIVRNGTFWVENLEMSCEEIYHNVKNGQKPYFRPTLSVERKTGEPADDNFELNQLISRCWSEEPTERPEFHQLKSIIKRINKDGDSGGNLLDNLLSRMEQYAYNLEGLVEERTADYLEQKKKAEDLLYMMLPRSVAVQLMQGESIQAEKFESVTIYFSDICGFTAMSAESTPMQVVDVLNDLYTTFDSVIDLFDVYKVETIGDAYMVVSGLPVLNGTAHAREIARMAITYLNAVKSFKIRHRPRDQLKLRIGIHSGQVCAGIVGMKMPRYCLFGDTVNTASRMESCGQPLRIHVSSFTKELLDIFETFVLELRGPIEMKGKGEVITWWLSGEINPNFPDLAPSFDNGSIINTDTAVSTCL